ncbi:MAG: hypothetical protein KF784_03720 [Fimbriimonadaceae bacterium]|nr:hypothetical protein [Fimbriimonadaceae bacterium]
MPLEVGSEWKYNVSGKFAKYVEPLRINKEVGVAGTQGVELTGPLGSSSMAWKNGVLYADRLAGTSYSPPLPLLAADSRTIDWKGTASWPMSGSVKVEARLTHEAQKLKLDAREYETTRSRLQLVLDGKRSMEVTTWFAPGTGIVRQEQRTGGELDIRIDYLSGP